MNRPISPWNQVALASERHRLTARDLPVAPPVDVEALRSQLCARYDFSGPRPLSSVVEEVVELLRTGIVHVTHPRYFGLFNPTVREAAVLGETLAAIFNPQLAVSAHAWAASELERHVLQSLARCLGMPAQVSARFTAGGAEANLSALLAALAHLVPEHAEQGVAALRASPRIYLSSESHHSLVKAARMTGLGRRALCEVPLDARGVLDPDALADQIARDRRDGLLPLMVVGTAGTTNAGMIDPLQALGEIAHRNGAWFHVDAAWGGVACLSDRLRPALRGIELADSITWDAHKTLSVPLGAGMFFCRHPEAVARAFSVDATYMPTVGEAEPFQTSAQWSRRALGLKVFLAFAELGLPGYAALFEQQTREGEWLRESLGERGWSVVNDTPLPVVCFTHPEVRAGRVSVKQLVQHVVAGGQAWLSETVFAGREPVLRACITSYRTDAGDIQHLIDALDDALAAAGVSVRPRSPRRAEPRVALVTCADFPELLADDRLALHALARTGVRGEVATWSDPEVDWSRFDALLLRSCWDYPLHLEAFRSWLDRVEKSGTRVLNPLSVVRWNLDKRYLDGLAARGVPVVPTRRVEPGEAISLPEILRERGWQRAVVKPAISGCAIDTWRTDVHSAGTDQARFARQTREAACLVQPYVPEVENGEWSLVFLGGKLSHAVLKEPAPGDFRVQSQFGGSVAALTPPGHVLSAAQAVMAAAPEGCVYARVDGCEVDGRFLLMELELIEPVLYLGTSPGAELRLAGAVAEALGVRARTEG